ncbi:MAG TPA: TolC family outer membrane protein [Ramlibacter sp.]|uniref:TolC family outer membrane protein n=1 Tax=Ramlibacter sp. TaxID=1917967 RepID=UPI002CBC53C4|nr:TolC family outer membrane protein [Ramlibacter sp.]HVZ46142.1 TolC family outer membrane protein [Ramlibacter sp.]
MKTSRESAFAWRGLIVMACAVAAFGAAAQEPRRLTLSQAYRLAIENDANLAAAHDLFEARSERLPQARAQLLPNISASANRFRNNLDSTVPSITGAPISSHRDYLSGNNAIVARLPLFRPALWADWRQAKAQVADAGAQYAKAVQDLAVRVTTAYMQVLLAQEQVGLVASQKKAYSTQLDAARKAFTAGSGTRTDVDEALAQLDLAVAQELQAKQNYDYTRRQLQALIDTPVMEVAPVDSARLPLAPPEPEGLRAWVEHAEDASPEIQSARAQAEAARQDVEKARAGHMPTVDFVAQITRSRSDTVTAVDQTYADKQVGVVLNVPIFAGGFVNSQVRQALASARQAEDNLEALRRDLSLRVEKEYRGVTEGVLQVRALEQAVRSAETAAQSASRSYQGGARTIVDVFNAEEKLVQAQRDLAEARYNYVLSRVRLQSLTGAVDQAAIDDVNTWLAP